MNQTKTTLFHVCPTSEKAEEKALALRKAGYDSEIRHRLSSPYSKGMVYEVHGTPKSPKRTEAAEVAARVRGKGKKTVDPDETEIREAEKWAKEN